MFLIEGVVQRRAAMPGGPEGHALRRHGGIGAIDIVGGEESGYVHQHRCFGRLSCVRAYFHDPLLKCRGDLCAKVAISLSNGLLNFSTPSSSSCRVTLSMLMLSSGSRSNTQ